jgi:hypothetical protein
MDRSSTERQWLALSLARAEDFSLNARLILGRLGYPIVTPEEHAAMGSGRPRPDLYIVDELRLGDIEEDERGDPVPIIVLTASLAVTGGDPRIVGAVRRPAGLHELYRLIQQVFEETPRTVPRVDTQLRARCRREGREWAASVLSLSENGCLLRCSEAVSLGDELKLAFELPSHGSIELLAEAAYQLGRDLGLVFSSVDPTTRASLAAYVECVLAAS